MLYLPKSL